VVGRRHREVPWHSIRWREERPRRPVRMWREGHPHVGRKPAACDELHLIDSLLFAPLVLEPDLDDPHGQPGVFS